MSAKIVTDVPYWLVRRCVAMSQRCQNPNHKHFKNYGGRGIEFRFTSSRAAAGWIWANLPRVPNMPNIQIDRIDNDGHYEPGNLQWATKRMNVCNTRRGGWVAMSHKLRAEHPEVLYADKTLRNLFTAGLTQEQIVDRFYQPSDKPKGIYGRRTPPDPRIVEIAERRAAAKVAQMPPTVGHDFNDVLLQSRK